MSAIGQLLACPKCGTMIEVKPPAGWQPPTEEIQSPVEQTAAKEISSSFDDIDNILKSKTTGPANPTTSKSDGTKPRDSVAPPGNLRTKQDRSLPSKGVVRNPVPKSKLAAAAQKNMAADQPILPTDQWTSENAKKRRRLTAAIATCAGVILLTAAIITAIINLDQPPEIAKVEPSAPTDHDSSPVEPADPDNQDLDTQPVEGTNPADPPKPETAPDSTEPAPPQTDPPVHTAAAPPDIVPDSTQKVPDPTNDPFDLSKPSGSTPAENTNLDTATSPIVPSSPLDNSPVEKPAPSSPLSDLSTPQSEIGDLSTLLELSGTSILKIQDIAEANRDQQLIGVPKYFIEQPDHEKLDFERQLSLPCDGMRYSATRLVTVLRELNAITGIPFTLDTDSIQATGVALNPTVDVEAKDVDFATAIDDILKPLGLAKSVFDQRGIVIHAPDPGSMIGKEHALPTFPGGNEEAAKQFVAAIQALFAPDSWVRENDPATITLKENGIVVNNTVLVHQQIAEFIAKINAAIRLTANLNDEQAREILVPRWNRVQSRLEQPTGFQRTPDLLLVKLFELVGNSSGVTVLIDWDSLIPLGWTPTTLVPGNIQEDSIESALKQIARSMDLTIRSIDETTVELTTFEKAARQVDLEMYHFGKILAGPLKEQQALRLITETLGTQLQSPRVRYVYEPQCQCLIISAPQSIQKQVASVIAQLEKL